jgi:hypothetical protein
MKHCLIVMTLVLITPNVSPNAPLQSATVETISMIGHHN